MTRSALTYPAFLTHSFHGPNTAYLSHNCGILLEVVHFCEKGFFRDPGEHTAQETGGQPGAQRWSECRPSAGGRVCRRSSGRSKGVELLLHFHRPVSSYWICRSWKYVKVGKWGSNLPQMTMPSTIYQCTVSPTSSGGECDDVHSPLQPCRSY